MIFRCQKCGFEGIDEMHLCPGPRDGQEISMTPEQRAAHQCNGLECKICSPEGARVQVAKGLVQCGACFKSYFIADGHACVSLKSPGGVARLEADIRQQSHYTQFKIQPAIFIIENDLGFAAGNVIKYVCRYKAKNGLQDLEKAKHYLDMLIQKTKGLEVMP